MASADRGDRQCAVLPVDPVRLEQRRELCHDLLGLDGRLHLAQQVEHRGLAIQVRHRQRETVLAAARRVDSGDVAPPTFQRHVRLAQSRETP